MAAGLMTERRGVLISGDKLSKIWKDSLLSQGAFASKLGLKARRTAEIMTPGVHSVLKDNFAIMARGLGKTPHELLEQIGAAGDESDELAASLMSFAHLPVIAQRKALVKLESEDVALLLQICASVLADREPRFHDRLKIVADEARTMAEALRVEDDPAERRA